jgi:hypothetical protein
MAKINYDAINFKNKDVDKFSTRFGKEDPVPAYAKGRNTNFAGYDRKREPEFMQVNTRERLGAEKQAEKDLNKSLNAGIPTKGDMRREDRQSVRDSKKADKPYRESRKEGIYKVADKVDRFLGIGKYDRGSMKKNMDMGGNRSKMNVDKQGQKKQDTDCKAKRGSSKCVKPKDIGNPQWTVN